MKFAQGLRQGGKEYAIEMVAPNLLQWKENKIYALSGKVTLASG